MATDTAQFIDNLVQIIATAEEAESVTNEQVARVFVFLCARVKELQGVMDNAPSVSDETTNRIAADHKLENLITEKVSKETTDRISADNKIKSDLQDLELKLQLVDNALSRRIETLLSDNATEAIDNFNEIKNFLANFKDSDSLAAMLGELRQSITNIQSTAEKQAVAIEKLTPVRIESEDAFEAMKLLGLLKPGQVYYIPEED